MARAELYHGQKIIIIIIIKKSLTTEAFIT